VINLIELSIFLPNKPGMLAELIKKLSDNNITLRAISVVETADYGLILLLVDKANECIELLEKSDYEFTSTDVLAIKYGGNPSILFNIAEILGENNVNIEYLYLTVVESDSLIILRVDNIEKGQNILQKNSFIIIEENGL